MAEPLRNEFAWSKSRDYVLRSCPRQYFYQYYASWGGWEESADARCRELYMLKRLTNRPMWVGDLVHRAVEHAVRNLSRGIDLLDVDRVVEITLNLMRNEFRASRRGDYRTSKAVGLFEHEYQVPVSDDQWRESAAAVEQCLRNLYASDFFGNLVSLPPGEFVEVEKLNSFDFEATKCWVVLDAAFRHEGRLTIVDWKTGRGAPGDNGLQLTVYALYAAERGWVDDPADLTLIEYNLLQDRAHEYRADRATVDRTRSIIRGSIADMVSMLEDPVGNVPFPEERFTQVAQRRVCDRCNFQRVCAPDLS